MNKRKTYTKAFKNKVAVYADEYGYAAAAKRYGVSTTSAKAWWNQSILSHSNFSKREEASYGLQDAFCGFDNENSYFGDFDYYNEFYQWTEKPSDNKFVIALAEGLGVAPKESVVYETLLELIEPTSDEKKIYREWLLAQDDELAQTKAVKREIEELETSLRAAKEKLQAL